jgi:hypothetical protein
MTWHSSVVAAAALALLPALAPPSTHRYRFVAEYFDFDAKGGFLQKQRLTADYAEGEPGENVRWSRVTLAVGASLAGGYGAEQPQKYMEGFAYSPARERLFAAEFFKGFPATATHAKSLVWDTFMLQTFAAEVPTVRAKSPYRLPAWQVPLARQGLVVRGDVQLTWVGVVERNRVECALVRYEAFFNGVERELGGAMRGARSDAWGDIWVSLATGDIDYATVNEEIAGELNVVRKGTFERLADR